MKYLVIHFTEQQLPLIPNVFKQIVRYEFKNYPVHNNDKHMSHAIHVGPVTPFTARALDHQARILGLRSVMLDQTSEQKLAREEA